jgi:hypothetical protein
MKAKYMLLISSPLVVYLSKNDHPTYPISKKASNNPKVKLLIHTVFPETDSVPF